MNIVGVIQKIADIGKSTKDKQSLIKVAEVWHLWDHLATRYLIIQTTNIYRNYAKDEELQKILDHGLTTLKKQVKQLETTMQEYGIPLPIRNPKESIEPITIETITDRLIYRSIFKGITSMIEKHTQAFIHCSSPALRDIFKKHAIVELNLFDLFYEYGKLKNYLYKLPGYRV